MIKPKLYVLDTGTMKMDKNYMIAMHNPANIDNPNPPAEFVEFPVYAVLIDHPEGKILFDTKRFIKIGQCQRIWQFILETDLW